MRITSIERAYNYRLKQPAKSVTALIESYGGIDTGLGSAKAVAVVTEKYPVRYLGDV